RGLSHFLLDRCDLAVPLFNEVLQTMNPNDTVESFVFRGLRDCAAVDPSIDTNIIPTPVPPTPVPPEPIGIF
ncbi:MAG: hypothetical protein HC915_21520, partial [Anaerolineae bacterium]|nr:hypothetical protein [Anaerolineae bacterium]